MKKLLFLTSAILLLAAACGKQAQVQPAQNQQQTLEAQIKVVVETELNKSETPAGSRLIAIKLDSNKITLDFSKEIESKGQAKAEDTFQRIFAKIGNLAPQVDNYQVLINGQALNEFLKAQETANWKTYTNTKYGYSIKYPQDWYANTIILTQDKDKDIVAELSLGAPKSQDRSVVIFVIKGFKAPTSTDNRNSYDTVNFAGSQCKKITVPISGNDMNYTIYCEKNDLTYEIGYENYSSLGNGIEEIISSFKFTK